LNADKLANRSRKSAKEYKKITNVRDSWVLKESGKSRKKLIV